MSLLPPFVHPALLWFLPLAAVPLVLHLLTLHRLKTVELSTFRFLFDSYVQQRRRMQLLEALLAVLRALFLLLLIVMVGRPVIKNWDRLFGSAAGAGGREVLLLVDCSASMNAAYGGMPALERAKDAACSVARRLGRDDRVTLVRVTAAPEEVFSRFSTDAREVEQKIRALNASSSRANIFATLLQLFGPEASQRTNPVIYFFTDGQSGTWAEARNQGLERVLPAGTPFVLVSVGPKQPPRNVAVLGDAPRRNRALPGLPFGLQARVVNFSKTESADVVLSIFIDEKEVSRTPLTLKPGEMLTRKIDYTPREAGIQRGRFEITGKVPDGFPEDDRYFFTLHVEPRIRVLLVNGGPSPDPAEDEASFLYTALISRPETTPQADGAALAAGARDIARSLDVQEIPEGALTADALHDASVVVLANCGALNATHFAWLREFVRGGGGLLVLPGHRVQPELYNNQFFPNPGPQGERLTVATMGPPEGDPEKVETFETLASLDYAHPALAVFDNPDPDARHFKTVRIYKRFKLTLPNRRANAWPLARFANGAPALVESRLGDGAVVLAAFPGHPRWTNLPTKPDFVPLLLRLVANLEHRPEVDVSSVVVAGGVAEVSAGLNWEPAEAQVKDPTGRMVHKTLDRVGTRVLAGFENTSARGYYDVDVRSERTDRVRSAKLAFAVNLAPEESDFSLVGENEVRLLLPRADLTFVDASAEAQVQQGALGQEKEIWPVLIWLVFGVIGVEFLLATGVGRRSQAEDRDAARQRAIRWNPGSWLARMTGARPRGES
jgi:hypothetical protein